VGLGLVRVGVEDDRALEAVVNAQEENDERPDDGGDAELAGLEDVDVADVGFERVENLRDDAALPLVEVLPEIDRA